VWGWRGEIDDLYPWPEWHRKFRPLSYHPVPFRPLDHAKFAWSEFLFQTISGPSGIIDGKEISGLGAIRQHPVQP
jgi:hypothetical protein